MPTQIFGHGFACRIIIQMVQVVIFPHQTFLHQMSIYMHVAGQKCLVPRSLRRTHWESMLCNMNILLSGWQQWWWWFVCVCVWVCARIRSISCQHSGRSSVPGFKLMPCQWMWRGTVHAGRGRSFQPSTLIVSLMYKIRVWLAKKTFIYTLWVTLQMCKLSASGNFQNCINWIKRSETEGFG